MRTIGIIITTLCFIFGSSYGQDSKMSQLQFSYTAISHTSSSILSSLPSQPASLINAQRNYKKSIIQVSSSVIPQYVRENPTGYSYLCRLELQIERELPVGVWLRIGDTENSPVYSPTRNAHVQFKLFNF